MNTINLNVLANKIEHTCPVLVESVSSQTVTLKGRLMPYRLYMEFRDNLPVLQIDLYDHKLKRAIENEVGKIMQVFNVHINEMTPVTYLNLTY